MNKHNFIKNVWLYLTFCITLLYTTASHAQSDVTVYANRDVSVWRDIDYPSVIYFQISKSTLLRDYRNNGVMLNSLDELLKSKHVIETLDTVEIIGSSSPVGSKEFNAKLSLERCEALQTYLQLKHPNITKSFPIKLNIIGVDMLGYNILKEQEPPLPKKEIWDKLQYAAVRLIMKDNTYIIPSAVKQKELVAEPVMNTNDTVFINNTVILRDTVYITNTQFLRDSIFIKDTIYIGNKPHLNGDAPAKKTKSNPLHLALKTNLLYDIALLPNLTGEVYLGKKLSLAVEGNWSWWTAGKPVQNFWYHRIQVAGVEFRRWFASPYPLRGNALGIYGMYGNYDVRLFPKNEKSEGCLSYKSWSAGLSYSYSFPISNRFNMELGLAAGYVAGLYYKYEYCLEEGQWEYKRHEEAGFHRKYFGPTRVNVSLVWLLGKSDYTNHKKTKK